MYLKPLNNANHGDQIIQSSLLIVSQRPGWLCHNVLIVMFGCNTLVLIWNQPEVEYWYCRGFFVVVFFFSNFLSSQAYLYNYFIKVILFLFVYFCNGKYLQFWCIKSKHNLFLYVYSNRYLFSQTIFYW